jgi:hypothetical protein
MRSIFLRLLAILLLCIPGVFAVYGWTRMRELLFDHVAGQPFVWLPFLCGLGLFLSGLAIVGGFIFYRDLKRNQIQARLRRKKKE